MQVSTPVCVVVFLSVAELVPVEVLVSLLVPPSFLHPPNEIAQVAVAEFAVAVPVPVPFEGQMSIGAH